MSLITDAVKRASEEKKRVDSAPEVSAPKTGNAFLPASAVFVVMALAGGMLYYYEESRITSLQEEVISTKEPLKQLTLQKETLTAQKSSLEAQLVEAEKKNRQKMDDLQGRVKVFQYEKETLASDISNKEKKIAELEAQIEQQALREEQLMGLIEQAKGQLARSSAAASSAQSSEVVSEPISVSADASETTSPDQV